MNVAAIWCGPDVTTPFEWFSQIHNRNSTFMGTSGEVCA